MATLNKTIDGAYVDTERMKPARIIVRVSKYKNTVLLEMSTFDGVTLSAPINEIKSDLIKALGE